jgi:hypothetical protein
MQDTSLFLAGWERLFKNISDLKYTTQTHNIAV